ncbi:PREDICTED: bromodomain-containing protein 9-like [Lupinus angustifolius]|uniref:bromodomain-containing protein 9-like n=1 Tax=Lupinus angustifolius TaxID=3871 RepID=UPI00092F5275|nr:PREDICTED: bromodomain-containing protein 9-like [Lupinus angustifolius]
MTRFSDRKATTAILKEGQRRSPRICALESNANNNNNNNNSSTCMRRRRGEGGSVFHTRGRKRTKLKPLQQLATNNSSSPPNQLQSTTFVPEKRILQLVLDTLQRRDTYEIFAEPVDPNEVENYYEIIEEPMDFGTMRAKLHEGMYTSLEQFEHDVFLIFNNAMHFNSAGTVYFRQARTISEAAKKVFDLLRTDPEKFELEFSETRRKVGRTNQGDFRDTTYMKSSEITTGVPSKTTTSSSRGTSNRKSLKANHGCSEIAKHVDARDLELPTGKWTVLSEKIDFVASYLVLKLNDDFLVDHSLWWAKSVKNVSLVE